MDNFNSYLKKVLNRILLNLNNLYYKSIFILNKQRTLQKMVEPFIEDKIKINASLMQELHRLKLQNTATEKEIQLLSKNNQLLKSKISLIQELLVKNNI